MFARVLTMAAAAVAQQPLEPLPIPIDTPEPDDVLVLPEGSEIELMVLREVDSDRAKPGDPVKLRVNRPVKVGDAVVIPVGTAAQGEVTATERSGAVLQRGNLSVRITAITLGGHEIPLGRMLDQRGRGGQADDVLKVMLAPMWVLFARGNSARLKAGELLSTEVDSTICFEPDVEGYRPAPCPRTT